MSTNLSNGVQYMNPHFDSDFAEFLLANDFTCTASKDSLKFLSGDQLVVVRNDQVELYIYHPEEEGQTNEKWLFEQSHIGISHLSLFGWMFLMHIMGVLKVSDFMRNARKAGLQNEVEAAAIVKAGLHGPLKKVG